MRSHFSNLFDIEAFEEVDGIRVCCLSIFLNGKLEYIKLVKFLFRHGRPVPRYLLLIEVEIVLEVACKVIVDVSDLRLHDRFEFLVAELAAAVDILLSLLSGLLIRRRCYPIQAHRTYCGCCCCPAGSSIRTPAAAHSRILA